MTVAILPLTQLLPWSFTIGLGKEAVECTSWKAYGCVMIGLWAGFFIGVCTEFFTSNKYFMV